MRGEVRHLEDVGELSKIFVKHERAMGCTTIGNEGLVANRCGKFCIRESCLCSVIRLKSPGKKTLTIRPDVHDNKMRPFVGKPTRDRANSLGSKFIFVDVTLSAS